MIATATRWSRGLRTVLGALALAAAGCGGDGGRAPAPSGPNVLLMTLDTTRADHLSCYGYEVRTSPNLDALAAEGVRYTRMIGTTSWTLPAHATLFTGKLTTSHGARYDPDGPFRLTNAIRGPDAWDQYRARGLAVGEHTLAMILGERGYATGAVVAGPWMKAVFGLDVGFDHYDDEGIDEVNGRRARSVTDAALAWLDERGDEPFFLFLNYYDAHSPYAPPPQFRDAFVKGPLDAERMRDPAVQSALYDAEIRYMDSQLGRLFAGLKERRLYDGTWIVVTADHGDLLGEQGQWGHGKSLTQAEIHLPLILKYPAAEARTGVRDEPVQLTDVLPLLLDGLGLALPEGIQGGLPPEVGHPIVAEVYPLPAFSRDGDWQVIFEGDFKYLRSSKGARRLFDLSTDPRERNDLAGIETERVGRLDALLSAYLGSLPHPGEAAPARELDEETMRALEGLGYVGGAPPPSGGAPDEDGDGPR